MATVQMEARRSLVPRTPGQPAAHREPLSKLNKTKSARTLCTEARVPADNSSRESGAWKNSTLSFRASSDTLLRPGFSLRSSILRQPTLQTEHIAVGDGAEKANHLGPGIIPSPSLALGHLREAEVELSALLVDQHVAQLLRKKTFEGHDQVVILKA